MSKALEPSPRWARASSRCSVGPVFALLPHPLHHEVAQLPASAAALPHVPSGVEVQGVMRTVLARFVELASGSAIQGNYFMKQLCIKCSVRVLLTNNCSFCHVWREIGTDWAKPERCQIAGRCTNKPKLLFLRWSTVITRARANFLARGLVFVTAVTKRTRPPFEIGSSGCLITIVQGRCAWKTVEWYEFFNNSLAGVRMRRNLPFLFVNPSAPHAGISWVYLTLTAFEGVDSFTFVLSTDVNSSWVH